MICPSCYEQISLFQLIKVWFKSKMPDAVYTIVETRKQNTQLDLLIKLWSEDAKLTVREHFVCRARVNGASLEDVAGDMNVTRERIRQIEAKALRKLIKAATQTSLRS